MPSGKHLNQLPIGRRVAKWCAYLDSHTSEYLALCKDIDNYRPGGARTLASLKARREKAGIARRRYRYLIRTALSVSQLVALNSLRARKGLCEIPLVAQLPALCDSSSSSLPYSDVTRLLTSVPSDGVTPVKMCDMVINADQYAQELDTRGIAKANVSQFCPSYYGPVTGMSLKNFGLYEDVVDATYYLVPIRNGLELDKGRPRIGCEPHAIVNTYHCGRWVEDVFYFTIHQQCVLKVDVFDHFSVFRPDLVQ